MSANRFQPRPTTYCGVRMRSRLEARAAAILDEFGFAWTYEPMCFADGQEQYLPDFHIPVVGAQHWYIEVKPQTRDKHDSLVADVQRMMIIRRSDPRARLALWIPERNKVFVNRGGHLFHLRAADELVRTYGVAPS